MELGLPLNPLEKACMPWLTHQAGWISLAYPPRMISQVAGHTSTRAMTVNENIPNMSIMILFLLARKIQNIIMFLRVRGYTKITNLQLIANFLPIGQADIAAAECIFGPNLGAMKGKTPKHRSVPVTGCIDGVPPSILDRFQKVVLAVNIMFVNKIPFLITVSRGLHFGTIKALQNCQVPTVAASLTRVVQIYHCWGFQITMALADPEFEPLQASFGDISFNFCAQDEHIPEIKCCICTVKDRTWSGYNSLPFERIRCLMLTHLVANVVFWLNAFPHSDGASDTLSPHATC